MVEIAYQTGRGVVSDTNEDRIFLNGAIYSDGCDTLLLDGGCLAAVCDGVGGEAFGEEAAVLACEALRGYPDAGLDGDWVREYILRANGAIAAAQRQDAARAGMSTTVAALWIGGRDVFAFNLGDSEICRYRPPYLFGLSARHTVNDDNAAMGFAADESQKHVITKYLGGRDFTPTVFDGAGTLLSGDTFLLYSDGVGDVLGRPALKKLLGLPGTLQERCGSIYDEAIRQGSKDNISVVIVRWTEA